MKLSTQLWMADTKKEEEEAAEEEEDSAQKHLVTLIIKYLNRNCINHTLTF